MFYWFRAMFGYHRDRLTPNPPCICSKCKYFHTCKPCGSPESIQYKVCMKSDSAVLGCHGKDFCRKGVSAESEESHE